MGPSSQRPGTRLGIPSARTGQRTGWLLLQLLGPGLELELELELGPGLEPELEPGPVLELELELGLVPVLVPEQLEQPELETPPPWLWSSYLCTAGEPGARQQQQPPQWEGSRAACNTVKL